MLVSAATLASAPGSKAGTVPLAPTPSAISLDDTCPSPACSAPAPATYAGPMNTTLNIDPTQMTETSYFTLTELAPGPADAEAATASNDTPDPVPPAPSSAPEPASIIILAFGLAVVITARGYYT